MSARNDALHKAVTAIVDRLPQRGVIPDSVARRWVDEVIKLEGERAIWHAHRAATIGGSEAGEFLLAAMNERPAYNSLEDIWQQKMLLKLPERPNIYMRRGTAMEPLARLVYLTLTGHKSVLDTPEIEEAFSKPHGEHPHIGGNPDDVVNAGKLRVITDFKVRNSLDEEKGVSLINGAQLHWYGLLHGANLGVRADGYGLAELDIPSEMIDDLMRNPPKDGDWSGLAEEIARINRPGFGMKVRYFPHNEKLSDNLVRLTKQFWERYVLTGKAYEKPKAEMPKEMSDLDRKRVFDAQNKFLTHKIAESVASEAATAARKEVIQTASKHDIDEWPFKSRGLTAGYSKTFNKEKAGIHLIAKGVDRDTLCNRSKTPDAERMMQTLDSHGLLTDAHFKTDWNQRAIKSALKENGLSEKDFEERKFRIGVTQKKADQTIKEVLESQMAAHIGEFMPGTNSVDTNDPQSTEADCEDEDSLKLA